MSTVIEREFDNQALPAMVRTKKFELIVDKTFEKFAFDTFVGIDRDRSGRIEVEELAIAVRAIYHQFPQRFLPRDYEDRVLSDSQLLMDKYDKDKSGSIDKEEYYEICKFLIGELFLAVIAARQQESK